MGIEAVGSTTTYQAQQITPVQSKAPETTRTTETAGAPITDNQTMEFTKIVEDDVDYNAELSRDNQPANEQIRKAVEEMNRRFSNSVAQFGIHEATNRVTIKIIDKETKEVIREFPPEKTLDMIAKAWELAGLLVDERR